MSARLLERNGLVEGEGGRARCGFGRERREFGVDAPVCALWVAMLSRHPKMEVGGSFIESAWSQVSDLQLMTQLMQIGHHCAFSVG